MNKWQPYGNNIEILPESKNKIIGDTSKYYLYGKVIGKGKHVNDEIKVGATIGYTLWGLCEILEADGTKHFFIQDNADFILAIKNEEQA